MKTYNLIIRLFPFTFLTGLVWFLSLHIPPFPWFPQLISGLQFICEMLFVIPLIVVFTTLLLDYLYRSMKLKEKHIISNMWQSFRVTKKCRALLHCFDTTPFDKTGIRPDTIAHVINKQLKTLFVTYHDETVRLEMVPPTPLEAHEKLLTKMPNLRKRLSQLDPSVTFSDYQIKEHNVLVMDGTRVKD